VCKSVCGVNSSNRQAGKVCFFSSSQVHLPSRKVAWLDKNESTSLRGPSLSLAYGQAGRQAGWLEWMMLMMRNASI